MASTVFIYTRHVQTDIIINKHTTSAKDLFTKVEAALNTKLHHSLTLILEDETHIINRSDKLPELPNTFTVWPEKKLTLWIFERPDEECKVWHLWRGDMPLLLNSSGIFSDGIAYDRFGSTYDDQTEWPQSILQLYTLPPDKRPGEETHNESYPKPSICWCKLHEAPTECPTAW